MQSKPCLIRRFALTRLHALIKYNLTCSCKQPLLIHLARALSVLCIYTTVSAEHKPCLVTQHSKEHCCEIHAVFSHLISVQRLLVI